ncbi:MAG: general secretion pathway protein GspB [Gammaproteobacteria bacterium]
MSFILESIKQAEQERKLGQQQAPSISIEHTSSNIDDIENKKLQWLSLLLGIIAAFVFVWSITNYYVKKDQQYLEELSFKGASNAEKIESVADTNSIKITPVKKLHASKLKSVKLISDENKIPVIQESRQVSEPTENNINNQSILNADGFIQTQENQAQEKRYSVAVNKLDDLQEQELVKIYSDLAELAQQKPMPSVANIPKHEVAQKEVTNEIVKIETASYIAQEIEVPETYVSVINKPEMHRYKQQHQKAVSSGVPSIGELPYDIQGKIPEFNVSVHMFHADPEQRRIRINGQMYTEGKSLQRDLEIVEITRYGAVFDYQGHIFRLNVR